MSEPTSTTRTPVDEFDVVELGTVADRVTRGLAFIAKMGLDLDQLNLSTLDLEDTRSCVLGQLGYSTGRDYGAMLADYQRAQNWPTRVHSLGAVCGFTVRYPVMEDGESVDDYWARVDVERDALETEWRTRVTALRNAPETDETSERGEASQP